MYVDFVCEIHLRSLRQIFAHSDLLEPITGYWPNKKTLYPARTRLQNIVWPNIPMLSEGIEHDYWTQKRNRLTRESLLIKDSTVHCYIWKETNW